MSLEGEEGFYMLPDEMLLEIFKYLTEKHLCCVSKVCTRFWKIANSKLLWKPLYHEVYEYDQPLILKVGEFEFISESEYENPWKESFGQLYQGVHVRPGFNVTFERDNNRNLQYFDTISDALDYVKEYRRNSTSPNIIFLHAGTYNFNYPKFYYGFAINMESNVMLIGAASGKNVAKSVIIKSNANMICVNAYLRGVYIGYLTLELTSGHREEVYCLMIYGNAIIDHCIIRSFNDNSAAVHVWGPNANPLVKNCDISICGYVGLKIAYYAKGIYQDNVISYNTLAGIYIHDSAELILRRNNIHHNNYSNRNAGIFIYYGSGCFEDNEVYDNGIGFIITKRSTNLIIRKNKIFNKGNQNYTQSIGVSFRDYSRGKLEDNEICNHSNCGVEIRNLSNPTIRNNIIKGNTIGLISDNSFGLLRNNYIFNSAMDNVKITNDSEPILKQNHLFGGRRGIYILNRSRDYSLDMHLAIGILDANVIFENKQMGVLISSKSQLTLQKNFIFDNAAAGVQIDNNGTVTLKFNKIIYNGSYGLHLASEVQPRQRFLEGNKNKICYNGNKKQRIKKKIVSSSKSAKIINL